MLSTLYASEILHTTQFLTLKKTHPTLSKPTHNAVITPQTFSQKYLINQQNILRAQKNAASKNENNY